jgi:hypothetical protein
MIKIMERKARVKSLPRKNKVDELQVYCRKCTKTKSSKEFYSALDLNLDKNSFMSICRECCAEIYENSYTMEHNFEKALLRTCKILNVAWVPNAVEATKTQVSKAMSSGKTDIQVFGIYKSKLSTLSNLNSDIQLTFDNSVSNIDTSTDENITDDQNFNKYLKEFWGPDLVFEDYEFLESELARYEETHKSDTASEKSLLRQICFAELDIRKARTGGNTPGANLIKTLQDLMKTASIDPSKASLANSGKAKETFSSFIKTIEETEPADFYLDKKLFKDFDGLDFYFKKYLTRPLKNFVTQSRDFNVEVEDDVDELVDKESEENETS